jgi:hypothetical protein
MQDEAEAGKNGTHRFSLWNRLKSAIRFKSKDMQA